jgi:type 1 fimbria pilin
MTLNKTMLCLAMSISAFSSMSMANDGTVNFSGDIVESPCVVSSDSQDQHVNLGQVKSSTFKVAKDTSSYKDFNITLEECSTATLKKATVTFRGISDAIDKDLVSVGGESGAAKGVGIEISDKDGTIVAMNKASSEYDLHDGQSILYFKARYKATSVPVISGHANGHADFQVDYK